MPKNTTSIKFCQDEISIVSINDKLYTTPLQVAHVLKRDVRLIHLHLHRNKIPSILVGNRRYIPMAWIKEIVKGGKK